MPLRLIPNGQLLLVRIPDPERQLWGWEPFAHSLNCDVVMGGFKACAVLANFGTPTTLTELRRSLFFEARCERHSGGVHYRGGDS